MSRQTPFARAFIPWIAEWSHMGLSGTQERVLLLLVSRMEPDGRGGFTSWFPRAEMAEVLGLSELTIRNATNALVGKGALRRLGKSYKSTAQKYQIMPECKGYLMGTPINAQRGCSGGSKGVARTVPKGTSPATPLRTKEGASASSSQPSAREIYRNRDGSINPVL